MDYIGYSKTKDIYVVKNMIVRGEPTRKFNRLCSFVLR